MKVKELEIIDGPDGHKHLGIVCENGDLYNLMETNQSGLLVFAIAEYAGKKIVSEKVLTVICNKGVHPIPIETLPGEVFVATEGSLPITENELIQSVKETLKKVATKIMELKPQKVYLVPSGLPVVLSQLQALCMQMLSKPAVILQWDRDNNKYFEINVIPRDVLVLTQ
jgi:hypothetical protein